MYVYIEFGAGHYFMILVLGVRVWSLTDDYLIIAEFLRPVPVTWGLLALDPGQAENYEKHR